jgi:hypothetical protein
MFAIVLTGALAAAGLGGDIDSLSPADREAYAKAAEAAGHDPAAHARLALWCEAHDCSTERDKHLSLAVKYDPSYALARGLSGLVEYQKRWGRPDDIAQQIRDDPVRNALISEYRERRAATPAKIEALLKLAAWCTERELEEQARLLYHEVLGFDPTREIAWRHLGFKKQGKGWVKPELLAAAKHNSSLQKQADRSWKTKLEKMRDWLLSKDDGKRARAEEELAAVTDPRAVPAIWAIFVRGGARLQNAAVQMLSQIDGPSASNGLAALAVFSRVPEVRSRALEALKRRDPREYAGGLIAMLHKPFQYEVRPTRNPNSPGELFVQGERFTSRFLYNNSLNPESMSSQGMGRYYTSAVPFDPFSMQNMMMASLGTEYANLQNQFGQKLPVGGFDVIAPYALQPIVSPEAAAQAAHQMAANPQNVAAILNQLTTNQANMMLPPLMWFVLANQHTYLAATAPSPLGPGLPRIQQFGPENQHGVAVNPAQAAMELYRRDQQAPGPSAALGLMIQGAGTAAQQDMNIARDMLAIAQAKLNLQQKLAMDVQIIESINAGIKMTNDRVQPVLSAIAGKDLGADPEKWRTWWLGTLRILAAADKGQTSRSGAPAYDGSGAFVSVACLAAGALVHTLDGPRPIEMINVNDRVLAQDTTSGKLTFQPVVAIRGRVSAPTLKVRVGGESVSVTALLRFWKAGRGWTMARELKAGDRLRVAGNLAQVESVEPGTTPMVYSVEVAECGDLFLGANGLLVHDFGVVQPVLAPFDRAADLGVVKPASGRE